MAVSWIMHGARSGMPTERTSRPSASITCRRHGEQGVSGSSSAHVIIRCTPPGCEPSGDRRTSCLANSGCIAHGSALAAYVSPTASPVEGSIFRCAVSAPPENGWLQPPCSAPPRVCAACTVVTAPLVALSATRGPNA